MQAGARIYPVPPLPGPASAEARPRGRARTAADVRRPALQGLGKASRQGGADHRRRFRHRPRRGGAVRPRGRRRRDRLSRRARGRRGDQAGRREGRPPLHPAPGRRGRCRILQGRGGEDRQGVRQARHPRQQRRLPGARQQLRGADRRALRPHAQDQSLRLFLHGARPRCRK